MSVCLDAARALNVLKVLHVRTARGAADVLQCRDVYIYRDLCDPREPGKSWAAGFPWASRMSYKVRKSVRPNFSGSPKSQGYGDLGATDVLQCPEIMMFRDQ